MTRLVKDSSRQETEDSTRQEVWNRGITMQILSSCHPVLPSLPRASPVWSTQSDSITSSTFDCNLEASIFWLIKSGTEKLGPSVVDLIRPGAAASAFSGQLSPSVYFVILELPSEVGAAADWCLSHLVPQPDF